jgi:hypothetical protein
VRQSKVGNADHTVVELCGFENGAVLLGFFSVKASLPDGAK